jgi:perosamine synthetase
LGHAGKRLGLQPIDFARPCYGEEEAAAAADVIRSGWVVGGPRLAELEKEFARRCGAQHGVGVSSWTTGAFLVLKAWGIGPGDEVIVPSLTFIASVNVISHAGATPVFVDIDTRTYNIDPDDVARQVTPRTRAIIAVDQIGLPCEIDAINDIAERHGLHVLDDAACAYGSRNRGRAVGSLAEATVFSLHARKVVTTGEGGMILTDDAASAERLRVLRHQGMSLSDFARHGASPTLFETYPEVGYNARMTDIQAAIGLVQLARTEQLLESRRRVAQIYNMHLADHPLLEPPHVPDGLEHNWQSYQVMLRGESPLTRNEIMDRLHASGIPTRRGVMASHLEPPYRGRGAVLPQTERVAADSLMLPMHSGLSEDQARRVLSAIDALAGSA